MLLFLNKSKPAQNLHDGVQWLQAQTATLGRDKTNANYLSLRLSVASMACFQGVPTIIDIFAFAFTRTTGY